ncbi:MAG: succinate dehydrogenase, cytochrome b556 subunit [Anaerolineae bacterium]|nr:succinate dehydrogenase, cytochrome b556 subunit [Anaerolineae bacterium]MCO5194521.1 succinate dehydrogenase, cytochrome b556 subunit [Anaerolineae bacterium]
MGTLITTVTESIRYRGRSGQYTWLAHRLAGLGILAFLVIHVWDTANASFAPNVYAWTIEVFKTPFFGLGEIAVFGAVLFHSFNGLRITLLDYKPTWWHQQKRSVTIVWVLFLIIFVPLGLYLLLGIVDSCQHPPVWEWAGQTATGASCFSFPPTSLYGIGS